MADTFRLSGSYETKPASGSPSGDPEITATLDESMSLDVSHADSVSLTVDTAVTVPFGGVTNANVVVLRARGGKVKARLTSADGSTQSVPVDALLIVISSTVPVTAIDLTRVTGTSTTVKVFLGQKAS